MKAPPGVKPTDWRARTKFRDLDGKTRDVERWSTTKTKAEAALKTALTERRTPTNITGLRADMAVVEAGEFWLAQIERAGKLSANTIAQYRGTFNRQVKVSGIASLTLHEVNRVAVLESYLQAVAEKSGRGSAKTARSVVSSILNLAVRHDAIDGNRMRDTELPSVTAKASVRVPDRAFSAFDLSHVLFVAAQHEGAMRLDIVDLVHFMGGTGSRIGEALAVRWDDLAFGNNGGEVHLRGTKTDHADRYVPMPEWLTVRLLARGAEHGTVGVVFHSPGTKDREKPRDQRNVARGFRALLDDAGFPWATSHTFRTTVGHLVTQGMGVAAAANVLGHSRASMTYDHYADRRQLADGAALTLAGVVVANQSGG